MHAESKDDTRLAMVEVRRTLVALDLTGFTKAAARASALELASFLDRYYAACSDAVARARGRVVKFMGDGCFAIFDEETAATAVQSVLELGADRGALDNPWGMRFGANVHIGVVAEGEIGRGADRRFDVVGGQVNVLFRMGAGPGLRLSEPAYRALPNELRGPFAKHKPPAVYSLDL